MVVTCGWESVIRISCLRLVHVNSIPGLCHSPTCDSCSLISAHAAQQSAGSRLRRVQVTGIQWQIRSQFTERNLPLSRTHFWSTPYLSGGEAISTSDVYSHMGCSTSAGARQRPAMHNSLAPRKAALRTAAFCSVGRIKWIVNFKESERRQ